MRYYFENDALTNVVNTLSIASGEKDAKIVVIFGEMADEKNACNVATCLGGTEQVNIKFLCEKPAGYEKPEKFAFDAKIFISMLTNVLSLKERTYIETGVGCCYVGVDGKANLPMMAVDAEEVPDGIPMDTNKTLVQCSVKASDLISALRAGAYVADGSDQFANAGFVLKGESIYIYSTDGHRIARGTCGCKIPPKNEELEQRYQAFLKEKGLEAFAVALPKKVVSDLQKLGSQAEMLNMVITDRHIIIAPNRGTIYAASLGAKYFNLEKLAEEWVDKAKNAEVVVDMAELKSALDLLLKFMDVSGKGNSPILMTVKGNEVQLEQTEGSSGSTHLKVVESSDADEVTFCFNGKKVMETLNSLSKGNVKLSFMEGKSPVMFSNGSLEQNLLYGHVSFVLPVTRKEPAEEKSSDADSVENGEGGQAE